MYGRVLTIISVQYQVQQQLKLLYLVRTLKPVTGPVHHPINYNPASGLKGFQPPHEV